MDNKQNGREKNITGQGKGVKRRGEGTGTGKVGSSAGIPTPPSGSNGKRDNGGGQSSGGGGIIKIIILLAALLGGGSLGAGLLGGGNEDVSSLPEATERPVYYYTQNQSPSQSSSQYSAYSPYGGLLEALLGSGYSGTQNGSNLNQGFSYEDLFGFGLPSSNSQTGSQSSANSQTNSHPSTGSAQSSSGNYQVYSQAPASKPSSSGWVETANTGKLNRNVDPASAKKRTVIKGKGKDIVTVMVYMCGTDLESKSGMGTKDLQEMLNADIGSNVNLLVYTGGCRNWRNNIVSSSANQIYQVKNGSLVCLEKNMGKDAMVKPATLSTFIQYCKKNFPANRNMLVLWDHGAGSVSGYGYDEKYASSGSMNLKGLNEALSSAGVSFDFIGFDACLMGTVETALTMAPYADYLIGSEESEPGVGWYYTNWISALSKDTSISTLDLGKIIIDDFVNVCAQKCAGQKTTLSLTDLAELQALVPDSFSEFALSTTELLENDGYATVSNARSKAREFAASSRVDQIDLVHMAINMKTEEGRALADTLLSAIKYNRTSSNMTNAFGLSCYFPYKRSSTLNQAVATYDAVGISAEYTECIKRFTTMQSGGQSAAGSTSPLGVLGGGSSSGSDAMESTDLLSFFLGQLLGGGRSPESDRAATYILENSFDADALIWQDKGQGASIYLPQEQWALIQELELNVFVDVGDGYADLGLDNTYTFTSDGALLGVYDGTWLAIDGQEIAYYHIDSTIEDGKYTITGRVPILLNGDRADLILVFDSDNPFGYIAGARFDYREGETDTIAKICELEIGDTIDFLCDFYTYDGEFDDAFMIGDQVIFTGEEVISNVYLTDDAVATYRFTDIYNNSFWSPTLIA